MVRKLTENDLDNLCDEIEDTISRIRLGIRQVVDDANGEGYHQGYDEAKKEFEKE